MNGQSEQQALAKRFAELSARAERRGVYTFTPFLDLAQQSVLRAMERRLPLPPLWFGGYDGAERQLACFGRPEEVGAPPAPPIVCLQVTAKSPRFARALGHRDLLGAVMALGIKRELIGDILPRGKGGYVFCLEEIGEYLCAQLTEVGSAAVTCTPCAGPEGALCQPEPETVISASLRLDGLIAAVWDLSRSESAGLFPKQLVFVNGRGVLSPGENARPGDIVSVRGRGRFRLEGVSGETRKGRLRVTVARY